MADEKLNSQDLIEILVNKHGLKKENAETFLKEFFLTIEEGLEKDSLVKVKGLGTFKLIEVKSRESINVNTGERFEIQGHTKVSFTPEASIRDAINKPFAHFETIILKDGVTFSDDQLVDDDLEQDLGADNDIDDNDMDDQLPESTDAIVSDTSESDSRPVIVPISIPDPIIATSVNVPPAEPQKIIETPLEDTTDKEVVEEKKVVEEVPAEAPESKESNTKAVLAAILLTLIICGAAIIFIFFPDLFSSNKNSKNTFTLPPSTEKVHPVENTDSIAAAMAIKDSIAKAAANPEEKKTTPTTTPAKQTPVKQTSVKQTPVKQTPVKQAPAKKLSQAEIDALPVNPDYSSYNIVGTRASHTIKAGETLTRISYRYYGTKDLWPYLVMHNKKKIPNSNNITAGISIQIPELKKK